MKLAITTSCNLNCKYCYVNKTKEYMDLKTSKHAINLLMQSPGKDKVLSIYGGEPLLNFSLLKKIIPYSVLQGKYYKKSLSISCCTNGTLITKNCLYLFRDNGVELHLSLGGKKTAHDKFRNSGTYDIILDRLALIHKTLPKEKLCACFCIFPSETRDLEKNFYHIVHNLGFDTLNFEIIMGHYNWTKNKTIDFIHSYLRILRDAIANIKKSNFIFFNPISWEIKYGYLTKMVKNISSVEFVDNLFKFCLEIYPSGDMAFSPFQLNKPDKNNYIIGNVNSLKNSIRTYTTTCCLKKQNVKHFFDLVSLEAAKIIQKNATTDKSYADYISNAKKRIS